jgi:hypothetical protein
MSIARNLLLVNQSDKSILNCVGKLGHKSLQLDCVYKTHLKEVSKLNHFWNHLNQLRYCMAMERAWKMEYWLK